MILKSHCIYLRKSRADRDSELTSNIDVLKRHEEILLKLAKDLKLNIVKIYREVVSGDSISARPEMQNLLRDVESGIYEGVLVVEVERLARGDTKDQGIVSDTFKYSNTKIITPVKTYDPSNEFDEEYFEFGLFMSRREYKTINRRLQRGRLKSASEGKWIASEAPYGYRKVKIKGEKGYTLDVDQEESRVVKMIFDWYVNGDILNREPYPLGMTAIANKLDAMLIRPRRAEKWSKASIHDILINPAYIGMVRWQYRRDKKEMISGTIVKTRPKSKDCLLYDGLHDAIIEESVFHKAQKIMNRNTRTPITLNKSLKNPLAGLIYCEKCGSLMTRLGENNRMKYDAIKCTNRYCDNVSAPVFLVEEKVIEALKDWLRNYELECKMDSIDDDSIQINEQIIKNLREEENKLNAQLEKTYTLLEQGIYSTEIFLQRNKAITNKLSDIKAELDRISASYEQALSAKEKQESIVPEIKRVIDVYETLNTIEAKNELLKSVVDRITYLKTERNTRGKLLNANFEITIYPKLPEI